MSLEIQKEVKAAVQEQVKKRLELKKLASVPLDYDIIRDLINSCRQDVRCEIRLADGTLLTFVKEDPFDKHRRAPEVALF